MVGNNSTANFLPGASSPFVDSNQRITPAWQQALGKFPTNITISGGYNLNINISSNTNITFPSGGTLVTLPILTWDNIKP